MKNLKQNTGLNVLFTQKFYLILITERVVQNRENRLEELSKPMTEAILKREKTKMQQEEEDQLAECTFKPKLVAKQTVGTSLIQNEIENRLYGEALKRTETQQRTARMTAEKELAECTFKPDIQQSTLQNNTKMIEYKPIYERVKFFHFYLLSFRIFKRKRMKNCKSLEWKTEGKNPENQFHPIIDKTSEEIMGKQICKTVVERLCKDTEDRIEKNYKKIELKGQAKADQHPFTPVLCSNSKEQTCDFLERQARFEQLKRDHQEQKYAVETAFTFHPEIDVTSENLVEADPKRSKETELEKIKRLAQRDKKRKNV